MNVRRFRPTLVALGLVALLAMPAGADAQATDPPAVLRALAAAINAGNVDASVALFADDATYLVQPGTVIAGARPSLRGVAEIRQQMEALRANRVALEPIGEVRVVAETVIQRYRARSDTFRQLGIDALELDWAVIVRAGKITASTIAYTRESVARVQAAQVGAGRPAPAQAPRALPRTGDPGAPWPLVLVVGMGLLGVGLALRRVGRGAPANLRR